VFVINVKRMDRLRNKIAHLRRWKERAGKKPMKTDQQTEPGFSDSVNRTPVVPFSLNRRTDRTSR
jgi:hypothetical protein